ncbi:glycosyltransferase [Parasphingopyxis marina]|uniref:Glycosyltransferase n=1 Tax=Parasphingopyxis marina TaxID=2761622 RepID=A0A842HZC3_9SPHN|nr:glycosyltransferase [Parasphingopyxis marina]MBC2778302.1 glycosyltransferase [Parasphingopyxis marina]
MTGSFTARAQRPDPASDRLSLALDAPLVDPVACAMTLDDALAEAAALLDEADRGEFTPWLLSRAIDLAAQFPVEERLQWHVGKLIAIAGDRQESLACWRCMAQRFPSSFIILPEYMKAASEALDVETAGAMLAGYLPVPEAPANDADALLAARCFLALGRKAEARTILDGRDGGSVLAAEFATERARLLKEEGRYEDAARTLTQAGNGADREIATAVRLFGSASHDGPPSVTALQAILDDTLAARRERPPRRAGRAIGGIVLIGGTLGGGGAERQLVNTAMGLQGETARRDGRIGGPVSIFCRKLDTRRANDFYLPRLEQAGIRVGDYLAAPPWGGLTNSPDRKQLRALVALLPPRMREGIIHLTETLRYEAPDIAQIWQDGMIFAAGLAALLAGVPRIILNVRTMPPSARRDRQKPEQHVLYRGLLSAAGVTLSANSAMVARAYEEWLELAPGSVAVIANGVARLPAESSDEEQARWQAFDRRTGGGFTLGGVMRLDENKRPLFWLEICAALAKSVPEARFVLAGNGPLREAARAYAQDKGMGERTLFVGRSAHIGFWLERMDALALTSRHEGMPNALIEAQLAGLPVVSTPAGGAAEAVAPMAANHLLADADHPDAVEAAAHLARLAQRGEPDREADRIALKHWAERHFAMDRMIDRTIELFAEQE